MRWITGLILVGLIELAPAGEIESTPRWLHGKESPTARGRVAQVESWRARASREMLVRLRRSRASEVCYTFRVALRFTWDPRKARLNLSKHGVSFAEAATVFADPLALFLEDLVEPERAILIGLSEAGRLLVTVHVEIHEELIRIISARRATAHERRAYEEES
jgi:uncharacterized protein